LPQRKGGSIFTPIDENRSILSQHLAAFHAEPLKADGSNRPQTLEVVGSFPRSNATTSPPAAQRAADGQAHAKREGPMASIPETTFTPPSRSNSLRVGGGAARPRLKVQIPDEPSDGGSATAESGSPRGASTDGTSQPSRRPTDSHSGSGVVLPPPSPSATTLLSAGATGPPNPFARPNPHHQNNNNMNIDTPVSALPSRFMSGEFLPSPNAFYNDWNFRGSDSNTLPSPLNFTTPVVGTGPSFLREDPTPHKRKSPEVRSPHPEGAEAANEAKRIKVDS
jgi:MADS-box transcription factor